MEDSAVVKDLNVKPSCRFLFTVNILSVYNHYSISMLENKCVTFPTRLFEWLVTFINNSVCADKSTWCNFIGKSITFSDSAEHEFPAL